MSSDSSIANLEKVDHVVVLMMENRSFDHMLGYLSLTGGRADIDGLRPGLANEYQGRSYPVHHLTTTKVDVDPDHSASAVDVQIGDGRMDGFVASLAATLADRGVHDGDPSPGDGVLRRRRRARATITWPRSSRSVTAGSARSRARRGPTGCTPCAAAPPEAGTTCRPIGRRMYDKPSFVRHLDAHDVSWRWYCFDTPTLRLADAHYTAGHHRRFGYFSKTGLSWKTRIEIRVDAHAASFLDDAASGSLPSVSWIDPAFTSFNPLGFRPNDDHAPADISDGQDLVLAVYDALAASPAWERSLLVIAYDEHGGFYDHVPPPEAADDDPAMFGRYGVRVPAIIVSPWVEPRSVSSTVFDHTSIIKSILLRFCPQALDEPAARQEQAGRESARVIRSTSAPASPAPHIWESS